MTDCSSIVDKIVELTETQNNEPNKYKDMHTPLKMYHPLKEEYVKKFKETIKQIENN